MSFHHEFKKEDPIFSSLFFENIIFQYIIYKLHLIAIKIFSVIQFFINRENIYPVSPFFSSDHYSH